MDPKAILESFRLDGKVALVTGASRGLGRAMALALAGAGAEVALAGRDAATLAPVAAEIESGLGRKALCLPLNVADLDQLEPAVETVVAQYGRLDILVNNAGTNVRRDSLEVTPADWDAVIDTNLKGAFFMAQAAGRRMVAQGFGKILNIGSMSAYLGLPTIAAYSAAKAGLQQLTRMLAVEWADYNVQVNAIAPGWFRTEMTAPLQDRAEMRPRYDWVVSRTPMGRFAEPVELAGAAVFLCSSAADFITGQVIVVDGGILAGSDWRKGPGGPA